MISIDDKCLQFNRESYRFLINSFLESGYQFRRFDDAHIESHEVVYLRHDVDFSIDKAYEMALSDKEMGVYSTFFLLPNSELYNLYSASSKAIVCSIHEMGHDICLHVDNDSCTNFEIVTNVFKEYYPFAKPNIIGFHQPNKINRAVNMPKEIINVYSERFSDILEYVSDSRGEWKYGYPLHRTAYSAKRSFHMLTHPLWWFSNGETRDDILNELVESICSSAKTALHGFDILKSLAT